MKIEDHQLNMAKTIDHAQNKVSVCQVRIAEYSEALMKVELEKAEVELHAAKVKLEASIQMAQRTSINTANSLRPAFILQPDLVRRDDGWETVYGDLVVYGDTPELAHQNFDEEWTGRYEP